MSLNKKEHLTLLFILFIFTVLITYVQYTKWVFNSPHRGDSAFLLEVTENIANNNSTKSYAFGAFYHFNLGNIQCKTADVLCTKELNRFSNEAINVMSNHSYLILYLIAPLTKIIDTKLLFYCLHVLSFFILLYFTYKILRESEVPIVATILFLILVFIHPAFSLALSGQFYVERLFLGFSMMFLYFVHKKELNLPIIYITGFILCLLTERIPVYVGIFMVMYIVLFWKNITPTKRLHLIILTFLLFVYATWALSNIKELMGSQVSSFLPSTMSELITRFSNTDFVNNLYIFLIFSILFMGIFTFIHWKYLVILIVMLIPNSIGNIGGAEKYGYLTHYHTLYFPFLVFLSALGYAKIIKKLGNSSSRFTFFTVVLILASSLYSPYDRDISIGNAIKENALFRDFHLYKELFIKNSFTRQYINNYEKLNQIIPKKAVVSSSEFIIALLWKDRIHYMFPLGIDQADYVVLYAIKEGENYKYSGFTSYVLSPDEIRKVDDCMIERMKKLGYDFKNQVIVNDYAVIKRNKK